MIKNGKLLHMITSNNIADIVDFVNRNAIQREDIVSILPDNEQFRFLYYYGG